ncbi:MAG: hypothetical protein U1F31_16180 [Steroidobacteraceae bacterium]
MRARSVHTSQPHPFLELVGERTFDLGLDGADFFDLGWSPLLTRCR